MEAVRVLFQWLALTSGFANAISFIPQIRRLLKHRSAQDLALTTLGMWVGILFINTTHLLLQGDWYLGSGLGASWVACTTTFLLAVYYRSQPRT